MPDIGHERLEKFGVCGLASWMLDESKKEEFIQLEAIQLVMDLCTNQSTKCTLIAAGVFQKLVTLLSHPNFHIRIATQKAILFFHWRLV